MPEPHPAEVRLAALRALLLEILEQPADAPIDDPRRIAAALVQGADIRNLCSISGTDRGDVLAAVAKLASGIANSD